MASVDRGDPTLQGSRVAIVAAMEEELHSLRQRLTGVRSVPLSSGSAVRGRLGGREVVLAETGEGAAAAEKGLQALLAAQDVEALVIVGVAGALSPDLVVGDLVVAGSVRNEQEAIDSPDATLLERALASDNVVRGGILSVERIVVEPAAKRHLWQSVGGGAHQVVDLESATYAKLAARRQIPYLALRAVSDTATETLPLDFNAFRTPDGRINRSKVARHLIFHPHLVGPLKDLRGRLRECAVSMADVVEGILRA